MGKRVKRGHPYTATRRRTGVTGRTKSGTTARGVRTEKPTAEGQKANRRSESWRPPAQDQGRDAARDVIERYRDVFERFPDLALLRSLVESPPEVDEEAWEAFERELRERRLSFRKIE